ncbi:MAG: hypothetical protein ACJAZF_000549, partial [Granulosicoccus sp.]
VTPKTSTIDGMKLTNPSGTHKKNGKAINTPSQPHPCRNFLQYSEFIFNCLNFLVTVQCGPTAVYGCYGIQNVMDHVECFYSRING